MTDEALLFLPVKKALQDFDLALRGKKRREKFLKEGKKKALSVSAFCFFMTLMYCKNAVSIRECVVSVCDRSCFAGGSDLAV